MTYHPLTMRALRLYQAAAKARFLRIPNVDADADYAGAVEFATAEGMRDPVVALRAYTRTRCGELLAKARAIRAAMRCGNWQGDNGPLDLAAVQESLLQRREDRRAMVAAEARSTAPVPAPVAMVAQQDTHAVVEIHQDGTPVVLHTADAESCEAWVRVRGRSGSDAFSLRVVPYSSAAMVAQPCQQQQAKARAPKPARGERRYVTVRDTETGEIHRVLTSVARVGVAVVIFTPSNRHRDGALGGMLITHDDIRKAWVFNDEAEARRFLSCNRATGERVIRAELISDPA